MYGPLLVAHSAIRWLVLLAIVLPLARSVLALARPRGFTSADRRWLVIATSIVHTQLVVGLLLYMSSPFVSFFWSDPASGAASRQMLFFGAIHFAGMLAALTLVSIGSALARREADDRRKFRRIVAYWGSALVVILAMIPWPFSPLAQRPLVRPLPRTSPDGAQSYSIDEHNRQPSATAPHRHVARRPLVHRPPVHRDADEIHRR